MFFSMNHRQTIHNLGYPHFRTSQVIFFLPWHGAKMARGETKLPKAVSLITAEPIGWSSLVFRGTALTVCDLMVQCWDLAILF